MNLLLFHCPFFKVIFAGTIFLALAKIKAIANSAAEVIFEVGAFTTITPFSDATFTSTLSNPTPALAMTFKFLAWLKASASSFVAERINIASAVSKCLNNSSLFVPSQFLISNSLPKALIVAGDNSSAITTIGFDIFLAYFVRFILFTSIRAIFNFIPIFSP